MRRLQYSWHKGESSRSRVSSGGTAEGILFAEFVDRLNERSIDYQQEQIGSSGTVTGIIKFISFGIIEKMIG